MSGLRGCQIHLLVGIGLLPASVVGCTPSNTWNPQDALPGSTDELVENPPSSSGCEWAGADGGPYVKRILVHSPPIQVVTNDQVRLDARVLGLRRSYYTCSDQDSVVAVPEATSQYQPPELKWGAASGFAFTTVNLTTHSILAKAEAVPTGAAFSPGGTIGSTLTVDPALLDQSIGLAPVIDRVPFVAFPGTGSMDLVQSWFVPGTLANVAILNGLTASGCVSNSLVTYTNQAALGSWTGDCLGSNGQIEKEGELVQFSESGAALRVEPDWTAGNDSVVLGIPDASSSAILEPLGPITIQVKPWLSGTSPPDPATWSFIKESIALANTILKRNRIGLRVDLANTASTDIELDLGSPSQSCHDVAEAHFPGPNWTAPPDTVHLFVTQKVDLTNGYSCRDQNGLILLGDGAGTSTFAHELGHTLALRVFPEGAATSTENPGTGHVDDNPHMGEWNLMFSSVSDATNQIRTQLTLGQAFRMNFDKESWIVNPGVTMAPSFGLLREPVDCQDTADDAGDCPSLHLDVTVLNPTSPQQQAP